MFLSNLQVPDNLGRVLARGLTIILLSGAVQACGDGSDSDSSDAPASGVESEVADSDAAEGEDLPVVDLGQEMPGERDDLGAASAGDEDLLNQDGADEALSALVGAPDVPDEGVVDEGARVEGGGAPFAERLSPADREILEAAAAAHESGSDELAAPAVPVVTVLRALDKITARITELDVPQDQEVHFGTLAIRAPYCRARPPEEPPEVFAFLVVDDVALSQSQDAQRSRVFTGWMVASSPGLNPLEHPVYDVWVIDCRTAVADGEASNR